MLTIYPITFRKKKKRKNYTFHAKRNVKMPQVTIGNGFIFFSFFLAAISLSASDPVEDDVYRSFCKLGVWSDAISQHGRFFASKTYQLGKYYIKHYLNYFFCYRCYDVITWFALKNYHQIYRILRNIMRLKARFVFQDFKCPMQLRLLTENSQLGHGTFNPR